MKKVCFSIFMIVCLFVLGSCSRLSGLVGNENSVEAIWYNGTTYYAAGFFCAASDKQFLGYADNGASVYCVGNKRDPDFIIIDGDDNTTSYVKDGASVPTSGTVTKVLIDPYVRGNNRRVLAGKDELSIVAQLAELCGETQLFTVNNVGTDGNAFYYVYNGSNVSAYQNYGGYIAYVDGVWIYSAPGNKIEHMENNTAVVEAVVIEDNELIDRICKTDLAWDIER